MKYTFFTPGPSQMYPTVDKHMEYFISEQLGSISHRSKQFEDIYTYTVEGLRELLAIPDDYEIVFVSSGTEAMERIMENTVKKKSFHFVNGSFSKRWYEIAKELGIHAQKEEVEFGKGFVKIPEISHDTELVCITQNETSSGVWTRPDFIYNLQKENDYALIAVDIVSSVPIVNLDYTKLDCVFFSVQKNFGLPAGLGILILSPRAIKKAEYLQKKKTVGSYHTFTSLVSYGKKNQTPDTPNVLDIYLLGKVVEDFLIIGIEKMRKDIMRRAEYIYNFLENHKQHKPFVDKSFRSPTVIVVDVNNVGKIKEKLKEKRIIVGGGYGPLKEKQIRIANFPAVNKHNVKELLHYL